jgi:putative transposase
MIKVIAMKTGASTRKVCVALGLPRSSFYHAAEPTVTEVSDARLGDLLAMLFRHHRRRYGYRRLAQELADRDIVCAPSRIRRLMAQRGLRALQPKNFIPRTSDGRADRPSPNLLLGQPLPTAPDQVWAGDITFIPTSQGWLYLAVVIDLCSRRIVGWSLADNLRSELVLSALQQALQTRRDHLPQTIFHSDRGSQYGSSLFRDALTSAGLLQSMSARANPYQNAWSESFISTLKREMLQCGCFEDANDARIEIFEYIDGYYNSHRKHSSLGYKSPTQFESLIHSSN